jgi:intracellular multiplication protein IcmB
VASFLTELQGLFAQTFGLDVEAYTSLTTVEDDECFVTKDGGLMSLMHLRGHLRIVGAEELARLTQQWVSLLGTGLGGGEAHLLDLVFTSDPAQTAGELARLLEPSRRTARRQGLDLRDLFAERVRHLSQYTCSETVYLVLWTTPAGLPPATRRHARREQRREAQRLDVPGLTRDNQNPHLHHRYLVDAHRSVMNTLIAELTPGGFEVEVLPVAVACRAIRAEIDPHWTPPEWQPMVPGSSWPAPRERPDGALDVAGCWFPAFGGQLIPRDIEILDYRLLRVGDRLYQPLFVDVPQLTETQRFEKLLDRTRQARLPWRLLIRLSGGAQTWLRSRRLWTGLLRFASHQNKLIDAAVVALNRHLNEGHVGVRAQMALTTWVDITETLPPGRTPRQELNARTALLASHVQAWGACVVREATGNPVSAWVSTVPGLSRLHIATPYAAPLADVLKTLPVFRPASPWREGAVIYRTRDGKPFAYQPGSTLQGAWNELYFARPGSGKSVAMNAHNLALILSPGLSQLPYVRIIDIGSSSAGLVSLVREALPPARRHEAQFHAPHNEVRWAINPLDTLLGFRKPLPQERAFLVAFLSVLATPPGATDPPEGVADLAGLVLDLAYEHYGDEQAPKPYAAAQDPAVDDALDRHQIALLERPSWWEVVDALFEAGDAPAAIRAQRYAVPRLGDLSAIASFKPVRDLYGERMCLQRTGESPVDLFNRVISATVREWPLLAYPTQFDLGNARIASLDVAALCGDMTPVGQHQTAIAYLLARHVLGRDLFLDAQTAGWAPARYRRWHHDRVEAQRATPKKFCIDEKHRCGPLTAVNAQIVRDLREGRKSNVHVALASQILEDFTDEMAELATSIYIMEYASDETAEAVRVKFSLSASALAELRLRGTGPTPAGAPFLCALRTRRGLITQLLYLTTGPIELWALSTTAEDRVIRQRLYQRLNPRRARAALAHAYPGGTVKAELERRLDRWMASPMDGVLDREAVLEAIVEEVAAITVPGDAMGDGQGADRTGEVGISQTATIGSFLGSLK